MSKWTERRAWRTTKIREFKGRNYTGSVVDTNATFDEFDNNKSEIEGYRTYSLSFSELNVLINQVEAASRGDTESLIVSPERKGRETLFIFHEPITVSFVPTEGGTRAIAFWRGFLFYVSDPMLDEDDALARVEEFLKELEDES